MRPYLPLLAAASAACATASKPAWIAAAPVFDSDEGFAVALPAGWMRVNTADVVVATRDGPLLQRIAVAGTKLGTAFRSTKKVVVAGMLPQEAAEVVADDLASSDDAKGVQIVENVPAALGGIPGFRLVATYRDGNGLLRKTVTYGAIAAPWFYRLTYVAPARYYFDRDLAAFEDVVKSFHTRGASPATASSPSTATGRP